MDYDLEFDISTKLYTSVIDSLITTDAAEFSFNVKDGGFELNAKGEMSNINLKFIKQDENLPKKTVKIKTAEGTRVITLNQQPPYKIYDCKSEFDILFSLNYLKKFSKANNLVNNISIGVSDSMPIKIQYMFNDKNGSLITYHLAPKISD